MRRLSLWGPPAIWMALIFALSAQPELPTPHIAFIDQAAPVAFHFGEYAVLATLLLRALHEGLGPAAAPPARRVWLVSLLLSLVYAVSDEYHQSFVAGRTASWFDLAIDGLGAVSATAIVSAILGQRAG